MAASGQNSAEKQQRSDNDISSWVDTEGEDSAKQDIHTSVSVVLLLFSRLFCLSGQGNLFWTFLGLTWQEEKVEKIVEDGVITE